MTAPASHIPDASFRPVGFGRAGLLNAQAAWIAASLAGLALLALFLIAVGPSHIMAPWDVFIMLDGGWRIFSGAVPHTDFYNPIGSLSYALVALGMMLVGPSLNAYIVGDIVLMAVLGVWAIAIGYRRLSPLLALLLVAFVAVVVVANRPLGYNPTITSYAMFYNRHGWALLCLLMVQLFVSVEGSPRRAAIFDALSVGALLAALFFCKVNFFVFGVVGVALALLMRSDLRRHATLIAAAFALGCVAAWATLGINVLDYLHDIAVAGRSQSVGGRLGRAIAALNFSFFQFVLVAFAWEVLVARPARREARNWLTAFVPTLVCLFILGSALVITVGNTGERGEIPLYFAAAIILLENALRNRPLTGHTEAAATWRYRRLIGLAVVAAFFLNVTAKDAVSLAMAAKMHDYRESGAPASQRFDAEPLADFVIPENSDWPTSYWLANRMPERINEGLALLRRHVGPDSRLFVPALADPFSFALGLKPAHGVPLWWDVDLSHNDESYPDPETMLRDVDFVVIPRLLPEDEGCCQQTVAKLTRHYGPYFEQHFSEIEATPHWMLLARKPS